MLVGMWMTRDLVTVRPEDDVSDAMALCTRRHVRRVLVVKRTAEGDRLVGIASLHDLMRAYPHDLNPFSPAAIGRRIGTAVAEVMTRGVETVTPDMPLEAAARMLREKKIGALPVVRDGHPVGIVSESDVFRAFLEVIGANEGGVRVTFDVSAGEDAVAVAGELGRAHGLRLASVLTMEHDGRRLGVVRLHGPHADAFVDAVWRSGHRVLSVERSGGAS
jgi:acetoin utilization protein AcuB